MIPNKSSHISDVVKIFLCALPKSELLDSHKKMARLEDLNKKKIILTLCDGTWNVAPNYFRKICLYGGDRSFI